MSIKVLPKSVTDKIAAGEVIERPVSVVKELVENSIDADASEITIEIQGGGKDLIRITDNGTGIEKPEVKTAFLRHATSKIETAEDLKSLNTLGFRGEALASIAAVSRLEIITKTKTEKSGIKLLLHGGEIISEENIGCPDGTTIIVRDLFYNLPARHKFLKTEAAESGKIVDMVSRLALTETNIKFRLISNGKTLFTTLGRGDIKSTIISVYKDREYKELIPCYFKNDKIEINGYISRPSFTRANRRNQYFFVNGRTIKSKPIEKGVMSGYAERVFDGRYPIVFLFLKMDPRYLDINIHPNKKEIRFDDDVVVTTAVRDAIVSTLNTKDAVIKGEDIFTLNEDTSDFKYITNKNVENIPRNVNVEAEQVDIKQFLSTKPRSIENPVLKSEAESEDMPFNMDHKFGSPDIKEPELKPFNFDELTFGEAIFNTYITATDENNFYLFDQHAAHERVNYEKFIDAYFRAEKFSQVLLLPITLEVPIEIMEDDNWVKILTDMGYVMELFGESQYIIREIPEFMEISEAEAFANTFIDEYVEGNSIKNDVVIEKLITKACKSSIKAHDHISKDEILAMIEQLKLCKNPFSCPHGRPTFIKFSLYEIEKMFKRVN